MTNKFYIKQFVINDNSFQEWAKNNLDDVLSKDAIIGYIFNTKKIKDFAETPVILNLYLIDKDKQYTKSISEDKLGNAWELFFNKYNNCKKEYIAIFQNPPIENWLDTKDNWCKKIASEISKTFGWSFDEALSETYIAILKCYHKGNVYLGNLNYLKKSVYNSVLMSIRDNKKKIFCSTGKAISLDTVIGSDSDHDGNDLYLSDMLAAEELETEDSLEYQMLLNNVKDMLRKTFSEREIDQIINYKSIYLPNALYKRLLDWRKKHSVEELYEERN